MEPLMDSGFHIPLPLTLKAFSKIYSKDVYAFSPFLRLSKEKVLFSKAEKEKT
jgi:hypothetical protein